MKAFSEGQNLTVLRSSLGKDWPLLEFWSDKVAPLRKIMDDFTEPLMEVALAKRNLELLMGEDAKNNDENDNDNLLAHLVRHTQGK